MGGARGAKPRLVGGGAGEALSASGAFPTPTEPAGETSPPWGMQRGHAPFETVSSPLLRVQQKFNSTKISSRESTLSQQPPRTKNPSPCSPRIKRKITRAFSGQTRVISGQNRAILGRFWVDSGLSWARTAPFWAPFSPSRESPSTPGDVQKLHLPLSARGRSLFTSLSQIYTK